MSKIIILGSGAAPGVPSLSQGFGVCNPLNEKNIRSRTGTYFDLSGVKFLIDTSPDLRTQLLKYDIRFLDAVFYTHTHADHLHGIDDLREINRVSGQALEMFATKSDIKVIKERFGYLIAPQGTAADPMHRAALHPNVVKNGKSFSVYDLMVTPIELIGHNIASTGYIFNEGEVIYVADFKKLPDKFEKFIKKRPEVMIMPLTTPVGTHFHAGLDELFYYIKAINPKKVVINHMAVECDYDEITKRCVDNGFIVAEPAFDGMTINF